MSLLSLGAVTVAGYQVRTGDETSLASAVSAAIEDSESLLEEELRRLLPLAERTATFKVYPDGRLYPNAWPLTDSELTISGRALLGATLDVGQFVALLGVDCVPPRATVTWTGGYDATTLPSTLEHAIYDLARFTLSGATPLPVGASSASVGDVSVSFSTPPSGDLDTMVPGLSDRVRKYRNRWV